MANAQKARQIYRELSHELDDFFRRRSTGSLEDHVSRVPNLVSGGHLPTEFPEHAQARDMLKYLTDFSSIITRRQKKNIAGGMRYVLTEDDAFDYLSLAERIVNGLIIPGFHRKTDFSNLVFNDVFNLGLAYLHSVVGAVATEYISPKDAVSSKLDAVDVAKQAIKISDAYSDAENLTGLKSEGKKLSKELKKSRKDIMRPFELTPITQKKVYQGHQLMKELATVLSSDNTYGYPEFLPDVIFPVAQGGNEAGLRISNAYDSIGHSHLVYPLLYSIKTRKHRHPWIENDGAFLGEDLEGKSFLVTEDWVTTGNTLRGILNQLENSFPQEIRVATIKRDPEKSTASILNKYKFYVGNWSVYSGDKTDSIYERDK